MKFAFIEAEKATFPIDLLCTVLGVSRSGFYAWRSSGRSRPGARGSAARRRGRGDPCRESPPLRQSARPSGAPGAGAVVGRKRVARLMQEQGLRARHKRRFRARPTRSTASRSRRTSCERQFTVPTPNTAWVTDITYIWTREGWLYLVVILDLFSRRVVGWAMSERITRQLALDALTMALAPPPARAPASCITPIGAASTRAATTQALLAAARDRLQHEPARQLLGQRRRRELLLRRSRSNSSTTRTGRRTRKRARAVVEYLEVFYNTQRRHSSLGYLSPVAFERQHEEKLAA